MISKVKKAQILSLLNSGRRVDGRTLDQYRNIKVETNLIGRADGSARVSIGDTLVLAGIKYEIGPPFPDTPDLGVLTVNAEFLPLASPTFESGPPDENAIELARVIDRSLRKAEAVDLSKLCLVPGKSVWIAWIDIYVLNHDGNLIDASALATSAALLSSRIPQADVEEERVKVNYEDKVPPPLSKMPVTVTIAKIGDTLVVDPVLDEEEAADAKLSLSVVEGKLCAAQKSGEGVFEVEELQKAASMALSKGEELYSYLKTLAGGT
ncbi:MAG: RNA-binding protein [Thermoprotei archaeon]|nr:MAG: RNA-binding protein [Thermoprotei archaeon]RLF17632.1 MAG: RNA-binding protein [Thermoprotei archaeon]